MMRQYLELKEKYSDCVLFFRVGDFYEMFFEDAKEISRVLELVLTGKDCGLEERAPMCGIPFHAASTYISRLISKGYKVAIGEQVEDPATCKGLVKRDVIKVITPGTYVENNEENTTNTYLVALYEDSSKISLAVTDISTGEFKTTSFDNIKSILFDELSKISPKEIIVDENIKDKHLNDIVYYTNAVITKRELSKALASDEEFRAQFPDVITDSLDNHCIIASKILLKYIHDTQKIALSNINYLEHYDIVNYMTIDGSSRRNLELTENIRDKNRKGSLLWVLDKTSTAMGGRMLRKWIDEPLIIKSEIERRLDAILELSNNISLLDNLKDTLRDIYDIERIIGKVSNGNVNGKDMVSLRTSLQKIPLIKDLIKNSSSSLLSEYEDELDSLEDIQDLLNKSIIDEPPMSVKEGNLIKEGYNLEVDTLRNAKNNGKQWILALENKEREETNIKSLKVRYNKVFGYYIEVSKSNLDLVPEGRYIRKQTLTNAERYITPELKEMEEKILGAEEKLINLEYAIFLDIRNAIEKEIKRLKTSSRILGCLDCIASLTQVALENDYVKPEITEEDEINIIDGRHPVVEKVIPKGEFVSNNVLVNSRDNELLLITGPNMAGKSTYMRQVALITLMAQIGSFVPAKEAKISICDKIFTRIGASDDLSGGKSTFMVEMWEVSNILKNATSKSLILLDEVGRGTSTYDGLSIAWSVIEYIANNKNLRCKTLFATHYHELTKLEGKIKGVKNYSVSVKEMDDNVIFLRKIVEGGADQSYGIEVAKLAGLPDEVIDRAKEILMHLEGSNKNSDEEEVIKKEPIKKETKKEVMQLGFLDVEKDNLINSIAQIDVLNMTPMDAMNELFKLIKEAKEINSK